MEETAFIERLMMFIKSEGLVIASFADKMGVKPSVIYYLRDGRNKPGFDLLKKMTSTFGISLDWLLLGIGEMYLKKGENNLGMVKEPEAGYGTSLQDCRRQIQLLEKMVNDKEEIIKLLKDSHKIFT